MKIKKNYLMPVFLLCLFLSKNIASGEPLKPEATPDGVKFSFESPSAENVSIAGDFNNWTPGKDFLYKNSEGIWEVTYPLKAGKYEYKFFIDGSWSDGPNLTVELKEKDGKLFIPRQKGSPTPYSGTILVDGKLIGSIYSYYDRYDKSWEIDSVSSSVHFDLDWNAKPMKEAGAYARMEMASVNNDFNLKFKQGHFDFTPEGIELKAYYNEKFIQLNDPLKLLDSGVSLRYEKLDFFDDANIHKAFGLGSQGICLFSENSGYSGKFFYSNVDDTSEDILGIFLRTPPFGGRFSFGAGYLSDRGRPWTYAAQSNWFPNPEVPQGRSYNSTSSVQPWYKGFVETGKAAFDFNFKMHEKMTFFTEYAAGARNLSAVRWNEGASSDVAMDKKWLLNDIDDVIAGFKLTPSEDLTGEISFRGTKQKLGKKMYDGRKADTNTVTGKLKYAAGSYSAGIQASNSVSKNLGGDIIIDGEYYPYYVNLLNYAPYEHSNIPESDLSLMPFVSADFKSASFKLYGRFHGYRVRNYKLISGTYWTDSAAGKFGAETREALLDQSINIKGPLYLDGSTRYAAYGFNSSVKSYLSTFQALVLKIKHDISIKLGWGVDPEGFDEDIYEDNDLREAFLAEKFAAGNSVAAAERALELEKRISIKTEIKF